MAPRSIWNGTIVFGLVNVPVKVFSATESKSIHFHQVHLSDGARIEHRRVCPKDDKEVPKDEIVMGYELSNGSFVELTKEEIAAAAGERSKLIDVEHFVEASRSIPPTTTRPTTSAPATTARRPTGCCARRSSPPARSRSPAGRSTTASGSSRSARSARSSACRS